MKESILCVSVGIAALFIDSVGLSWGQCRGGVEEVTVTGKYVQSEILSNKPSRGFPDRKYSPVSSAYASRLPLFRGDPPPSFFPGGGRPEGWGINIFNKSRETRLAFASSLSYSRIERDSGFLCQEIQNISFIVKQFKITKPPF